MRLAATGSWHAAGILLFGNTLAQGIDPDASVGKPAIDATPKAASQPGLPSSTCAINGVELEIPPLNGPPAEKSPLVSAKVGRLTSPLDKPRTRRRPS